VSRRAALVAVVWVALLALPSFAVADGDGAPTIRIDLRSHDGYSVRLYEINSTATLKITKRAKVGYAESSTDYLTRATVTGDSLQATFGELGQVSMRFDPSDARPSLRCDESRRSLVRRGLFVGSLRFRGESGYVDIGVRRAAGAVLTPIEGTHCDEGGAEEGRPSSHRPKLTDFYAGFRHGLGSVNFWAETNDRGHVDYEAMAESGGEEMATYRQAFVEASPRTFATDQALSFLSVSPPYPFSGTGLVQRNPNGSRSWSGNLGVSFPGVSDFALTGPEFRTFLTRQW